MSVIHAPPKPELGFRQAVYIGAVAVALFMLFVRLWYLQVVRSAELIERAETVRWSSVERLAPRGLILDRHGVLLAGVRPELVITAIPHEVGKNGQNRWVLAKLAELLEVPVKRLEKAVDDAYWRPYLPAPIYVAPRTGEEAPVELAARIAEASAELPGISVETQPMRYYADTTTFAHILGYVWTPSKNDVDRLQALGLKTPEYVGKNGIEKAYEPQLMGRVGAETIEVDNKRRPVRVIGREVPTPGSKLISSIDSGLQKLAVEILGDVLRDRKVGGAIVALDPTTGEVLCMASSPTYDVSKFIGGISQSDFDALQASEALNPLLNRATSGAYSPGSTFKIVTTLAAIQSGKFDPNRTVHCAGFYQMGNRPFRCLGHHGSISFQRAFAKSCNTYFYDMAHRVGREDLCATAERFGLGKTMNLDLVSEVAGSVPTDEWIERIRKRNPEYRWYGGMTLNIGIGQGDITTTPLQMANVVAIVANGGFCYRPHFVQAFIEPGVEPRRVEVKPEKLWEVKAPAADWEALKRAMVQVIDDGTAGSARLSGIRWGGKTGSTEHRRGSKTHGWFVGIAPMDQPKIVVAVLLEGIGHGGEFSAPIAARIVKHYLQSPKSDAVASSSRPAEAAQDASLESPRSR